MVLVVVLVDFVGLLVGFLVVVGCLWAVGWLFVVCGLLYGMYNIYGMHSIYSMHKRNLFRNRQTGIFRFGASYHMLQIIMPLLLIIITRHINAKIQS